MTNDIDNFPIANHQRKSNKKARNTTLQYLGNQVKLKKKETTNKLSEIARNFYLTTKQMQLLQFQELEKARSDGYSGIKQIKTTTGNFYT